MPGLKCRSRSIGPALLLLDGEEFEERRLAVLHLPVDPHEAAVGRGTPYFVGLKALHRTAPAARQEPQILARRGQRGSAAAAAVAATHKTIESCHVSLS